MSPVQGFTPVPLGRPERPGAASETVTQPPPMVQAPMADPLADPWARPPVVQAPTADPLTNPLTQPPPTNPLTQPPPTNSLTVPPVANSLMEPPPGVVQSPAGPGGADRVPTKGELDIHERRTWRTWQLLVAVLAAAVLGMAFNGATSSSGAGSGSAAGGSGSHYKLPPQQSSSHSASGSSTTTTASGGATTTTTAAGSTSTTTATQTTGPATVLIPQTTQAGNWTSAAFTIAGGTWNIGWAFQCTPAPPTSPTFAIFVVNAGGSPGSTPAVSSAAASGQSVTPQSTTGSQQIVVQTAASCRWAVKVTGFSG